MKYQRKIIYIKDYKDTNNSQNTGFVKIYCKNNKTQLEINYEGNNNIIGSKIYLLQKDKHTVNKSFFYTINSNENTIRIQREHLQQEARGEEIIGIMIEQEGNLLCGGCDDKDVHITDYLSVRKMEDVISEKMSYPENGKEKEWQERILEVTSNEIQEVLEEVSEKVSEEPQEVPKEIPKKMQEEVQEEMPAKVPEEIPEGEGEQIEVILEEAHDEAYEYKKIMDTRTNMYPFEDDEMDACVQISPADFSDFPKDFWQMGSNTFLLQGYYNYRHLLLAETKNNMYVGIPGQYHKRDKYLADMFGFQRFKGIHNRQIRLGDFGYWLMTIEKPQPTDRFVEGCD